MLGIGKGIKEGEFIFRDTVEGVLAHQVTSITYHINPKDMFTAQLSNSYKMSTEDMETIEQP